MVLTNGMCFRPRRLRTPREPSPRALQRLASVGLRHSVAEGLRDSQTGPLRGLLALGRCLGWLGLWLRCGGSQGHVLRFWFTGTRR